MMMKILAFGIAKDIFGETTTEVDLPEGATTLQLKSSLEARYPKLKDLASYMVAVNDEYAEDDTVINSTDEVAIIPPVSGG